MVIAEEVLNIKQKKEFLEFPARLYKNDKAYIRPLDKDIEFVFDPQKNKFFENGICKRFLFLNENGETVGKVAAFHHQKYLHQRRMKFLLRF